MYALSVLLSIVWAVSGPGYVGLFFAPLPILGALYGVPKMYQCPSCGQLINTYARPEVCDYCRSIGRGPPNQQ